MIKLNKKKTNKFKADLSNIHSKSIKHIKESKFEDYDAYSLESEEAKVRKSRSEPSSISSLTENEDFKIKNSQREWVGQIISKKKICFISLAKLYLKKI